MLAESVHPVADSGNQLLLIIGGRRARRTASADHPFGYGRSRYVYAFLVSVVLFTVGGLFSIYEGINKLNHLHELTNVWLPITVLLVAIVLEGFSLRTAIAESNKVRGNQSWVNFVRKPKAPELPVVLLEDLASLIGLVLALLGVGLTVLTGNEVFDAYGTLAIGALLVVAVILGIEMSSLLIGEGAGPQDVQKIRKALSETEGVESVIHLKTLYIGPEELMLGAKIAVNENSSGQDIARIIDLAEVAVRAVMPAAKTIYLEPDILRSKTNA